MVVLSSCRAYEHDAYRIRHSGPQGHFLKHALRFTLAYGHLALFRLGLGDQVWSTMAIALHDARGDVWITFGLCFRPPRTFSNPCHLVRLQRRREDCSQLLE